MKQTQTDSVDGKVDKTVAGDSSGQWIFDSRRKLLVLFCSSNRSSTLVDVQTEERESGVLGVREGVHHRQCSRSRGVAIYELVFAARLYELFHGTTTGTWIDMYWHEKPIIL